MLYINLIFLYGAYVNYFLSEKEAFSDRGAGFSWEEEISSL